MQAHRINVNHDVLYPTCLVAGLVVAGCAGGARLQLSAAESLDKLSGELQRAVGEFHTDLAKSDRARRDGVIDAFVERVRGDVHDRDATQAHVDAFREALDRLRQDEQVGRRRLDATRENLRTVREIADGLRMHGLKALTAEAELRNDLNAWIDRAHRGEGESGGPS